MGWLGNRFQAMPPAEIASRIVDVGRHAGLRLSLERFERRARRSHRTRGESFDIPRVNGQLAATRGHVKERVIDLANQWLEHRANFFALSDMPLGESINWHCDYSSGKTGPLKYSGLINYRNVDIAGDVKYIWELNRLQQLVLLALAMAWNEKQAYGEEIGRQTRSWVSQNPFMIGLNWKSPLEAGIRLISWAYVKFLHSGFGGRSDMYPSMMRETIYHHQYFIKKFYSKHSSANNHLIGEMAGLYVGAVFWPWYRESAQWRSFAREKLVEEIVRQVEDDGVGKERATEYQAFIIELLLLAGALGHLVGDPFPHKYWIRLGRMMRFLSVIRNRAGDLPMVGDGDSAQAVWLPESIAERVHSLVQVAQCRETDAPASDLRATLLLWGEARQDLPIGELNPSTKHLEVFPDGGYCVVASERGGDDEIVVVFDAGPLGFPPLNAHGHADALSFWLSYGGQEFLIDPGTYCYHRSARWRAYFRGTAAHNTIRIDREDQSVAGGTFLWRHAAQGRIERVEHKDDVVEVEGSHDGYRRLADPVSHTRILRLFKKSRTLLVTDRLECRKDHQIEICFHFNEKCRVRQVCAGSFEASNYGKRMVLHFDARLTAELYRGSEEPIFGWVSRTFGVKEPSFALVAHADITGSIQFITEISAI